MISHGIIHDRSLSIHGIFATQKIGYLQKWHNDDKYVSNINLKKV